MEIFDPSMGDLAWDRGNRLEKQLNRKEAKVVIVCANCFGSGIKQFESELNSDGISVTIVSEKCKECNGYGYILEIVELPSDFVVRHRKFVNER